MKTAFLSLCLFLFISAQAQKKSFRFAFISDTHIGSPNGGAEEDLRRTVADINSQSGISFVVITGDITELGTNKELQLAKQILDSLHINYYIIPGNHDTGWSESGGLSFTKTFGLDKFHFVHQGVHFLGCASGPYVRMSDGHVPRSHINWLKKELKAIKKNEPVVFLNHYPLDDQLDNWYEVIDQLKQKNTVLALCGHGHNNRAVKAEGLPAVMGRSNLRAKASEGGYNLVDLRADSIFFTERFPVSKKEKLWKKLPNQQWKDTAAGSFKRPDFSINKKYKNVEAVWTYQSAANIISTPAVIGDQVVVGNQAGTMESLSMKTGKRNWKFQTKGPIYSSPDTSAGRFVFGSADGSIYCLSNGKKQWQVTTGAPVLGAPLIEKTTVYIGGSDHRFAAYDLITGKEIWSFNQVKGPITSKGVIDGDVVVFGAWDTYLYALNKHTGSLLWKWSNGSSVVNYSPAACIPVIQNNVVYVVAPDRYLSAIDLNSGKTLWRTNQSTVRESIGLSEDGKYLYGKTMQDTIVAYHTNSQEPKLAWKESAGFGYEHVPSMLVEKEGKLFFGTKNGIVYCMDPERRTINWAYKIDNSMVNTVRVLNGKEIIASTMDGKVVFLRSTN